MWRRSAVTCGVVGLLLGAAWPAASPAAAPVDGSAALDRSAELVPTLPWPQPDAPADVRPSGPPGSRVDALGEALPTEVFTPAPPPETRDLPPLEVVGALPWYQPPPEPAGPPRLYLERLLAGERVEGWRWDAGYSVETAGAALARESSEDGFSLGFDGRMQRTLAKGENGNIEALMLGPTMNWQPSDHTRVVLSPQVAIDAPYPMSEVYVAFSWGF